jgi:hypothetical protein
LKIGEGAKRFRGGKAEYARHQGNCAVCLIRVVERLGKSETDLPLFRQAVQIVHSAKSLSAVPRAPQGSEAQVSDGAHLQNYRFNLLSG